MGRQPHSQSTMGPQSQRRINLVQRTAQLRAKNVGYSKSNSKQVTLTGHEAFNPDKHCKVCKARRIGYPAPHRKHHELCPNNRRTRGTTSAVTLASTKKSKELEKHFAAPVKPHEKCSSRNNSAAAAEAFFTPHNKRISSPIADCSVKKKMKTQSTTTLPVKELVRKFTDKMADSKFVETNKQRAPPLTILALASVVSETVLHPSAPIDYGSAFDGLSMVVPDCPTAIDNPHCHSIVGQTLLIVDWKRAFGLDVPCPNCNTPLENVRTNWSKNKVLFPMFDLEGPPTWAIVMVYKCPCCKATFDANEGAVLCKLPAFAANTYPVDPKFAQCRRNSHISRKATDVFDLLMTTYANGDLCSRLMYNAVNRSYMTKISAYYSNHKVAGTSGVKPYPRKDGEYLKVYPPVGALIRDMFNVAAHEPNAWGISDYLRWMREIQSVKCDGGLFAQDHTFEVLKNYNNKKGAVALWDVATDTGETASAVLVRSTKTRDFSHAAEQLSRREHFNPRAMHADTWPIKSSFWGPVLFGKEMTGRLGLFHFQQRMLITLRKQHVDHQEAVNKLLECIYDYHSVDYEKLLVALKEGHISGIKESAEDIAALIKTRFFRQRYSQYLRKVIRPKETMIQRLDDWFCRFKCAASEGQPEARGRLDPRTLQPLFTPETKDAVMNCQKNADCIFDPLPLQDMCYEIKASPRSKHGLSMFISKRPESKLESFHDNLAHFGNCGMRDSLCDSFNLCGTVRYNLRIRHTMQLAKLDANQRSKMPAQWEDVVSCTNHTELKHINKLAKEAGTNHVPFPNAETLVEDTGERFFSAHLSENRPQHPECDRCECKLCAGNPMPLPHLPQPTQQRPPSTATTPKAPPPPPQQNKPTTPNNIQQITPTTFPLQQKPQQQERRVIHSIPTTAINHRAPVPLWPSSVIRCQPMPIPIYTPFITTHVPPHFTPPHCGGYCCRSYCCWYTNCDRKGRPPHDHHCHQRVAKKRKRKENDYIGDK